MAGPNEGDNKKSIVIINPENTSSQREGMGGKFVRAIRSIVGSVRERWGSGSRFKKEDPGNSIVLKSSPARSGEISHYEGLDQAEYHRFSSRIAKALEKVEDVKLLVTFFKDPPLALNEIFFSDGGVAGIDAKKLTGVLKQLTHERLGNLASRNAFDVGIACEVFMLNQFGIHRMGYGYNSLSDSEYGEVSKKATQMYQELGFDQFSSDFSTVALGRISQSGYADRIRRRGITEENSKDQTYFRLDELADEFLERAVFFVKWNNIFSEDYRTQLEEETKKIIEKMQKLGFSEDHINGDDIRAKLNTAALALKK